MYYNVKICDLRLLLVTVICASERLGYKLTKKNNDFNLICVRVNSLTYNVAFQ